MKAIFLSATTVLFVGVLLVNIGWSSQPLSWRTSQYENVLGTAMEIKLSAGSQAAADGAEAAARAEIRRLNAILSGYDRTSESSRWSKTRGEGVRVSSELMEVLSLWDVWRTRTGGALNPSAEAIARVWKTAEAAGRMPAAADLRAAVVAASQPQWRLDGKASLAARLSNTPLMLNS